MVFGFPSAIRSLPCLHHMLLSDIKEHRMTTPFDMLMLNLRTRGTLDRHRRAFLVTIHHFL